MPCENMLNAAFRRHHMGRLLHRIGALLPQLLGDPKPTRQSCVLEQLCWRELGLAKQPVFEGDLPQFLMWDSDGRPVDFSIPTDLAELAVRMTAAESSSPLPEGSRISRNLNALARLLNLTPFEFQWVLCSYCIRRFGSAILPVIPLRNTTHGCNVLALLFKMPADAVRDSVASRRLHTWGLLDGGVTDGAMPSRLSDWLLATDQFAEWIEQSYDSDTDLLIALCKAQVSSPASC